MAFWNKKKVGGYVYVGESTRPDGSKKIYTGMTRRPVQTRWGEHMRAQFSDNKKAWTSRGTFFRPLGAVWSSNPRKAEKTIKGYTAEEKRAFGRAAAAKYKKRSFWN